MAFFKDKKDISLYLWVFLWVATFLHAGQTLWAMLLTAQLPPGDQVPLGWADVLGQGPDAFTYWVYVIALGVNIFWESRFKGAKTYAPSSFPFPDMLYGEVALYLWLALWIFAHLGNSNGWFAVPNRVGLTLGTCFFLMLVQGAVIHRMKNPEGSEEAAEDEDKPSKTSSSAVSTPPTRVGTSSAKLTPKQAVSGNADLTGKLLDYVRQNGQTKTGALVTALGSPRRSVIRSLNKLIEDGHLVREGSGPGAVYRVSDSPKRNS